MIYFILIGILLLAFNKYTDKFRNPYLIRYYIGLRGMGKTTLATKIAIKHLKQGHQVFSNFEVFGSSCIDMNKFGEYYFPPNSCILVDEVSLVWSNRDFKAFKKSVEEFFRLSRKRRVWIYMFSQSFDVDKKIRDIVDELYILDKWFNIISVAKRIRRVIVLHQSKDEQGNKVEGTENFISEDYSYAFPSTWQFTYIPRWIKFFNSFEAPKLPKTHRRKYVFFNEAYLHKLKYWRFYKIDQIKDLYKKFQRWRKERKLSFIFEMNRIETWLDQAKTVNRKLTVIDYLKVIIERFEIVRQVARASANG